MRRQCLLLLAAIFFAVITGAIVGILVLENVYAIRVAIVGDK